MVSVDAPGALHQGMKIRGLLCYSWNVLTTWIFDCPWSDPKNEAEMASIITTKEHLTLT